MAGEGLRFDSVTGLRILVDEAAEDRPTLDPLTGEVRERVIGPGRAEMPDAMGRRPL
jgi:hypothetical protein